MPVTGMTKKTDKQMLTHIAKNTFDYFWKEANPKNGLISDATTNHNSSNAVVGFGLAGLCIAVEHGWITKAQAYQRALMTLKSFAPINNKPGYTKVEQEKGHHYHWVDVTNGKWVGYEGIYASDTSAFIAGVITVGSYFKGTEIEIIANQIVEAVDWSWFYNKEKDGIYIGWEPKKGFGGTYSTNKMGLLPIILGIASPTHPIPASAWFTLVNSFYHARYKDYQYVGDGAAYTHQWPFCFIDPRNKKDAFLDYYQDIRNFTLASRQWCIDHESMGYSSRAWGLNVALGPDKYGDYAAPVIPNAHLAYNGKDNDGTVVPTAAVGSIPYAPKETIAATRYFYEELGGKIFGHYGFTDTFNIQKDFWSNAYLGIDQGPILIGIDNYLNATVWKAFMTNPAIKLALDKIGYVKVIDNFDEQVNSSAYATWKVRTKNVNIMRTSEVVREGKQSLAIELAPQPGPVTLTIYPGDTNFDDYHYLALWQYQVYSTTIKLNNTQKSDIVLTSQNRVEEGPWQLVYYNLESLKGKLKNVKKIDLVIYPNMTTQPKKIYIDHIHLTDSMQEKALPLEKIDVKTGRFHGELDVEWVMPENKQIYAKVELAISEKLIKTWDDFYKAKKKQLYPGRLTPGEKRITLIDLKPGQFYSVAVAGSSPHLLHTDFLGSSAIANAEPEIKFDLNKVSLTDKKELYKWKIIASDFIKARRRQINKDDRRLMELVATNRFDQFCWFGVGREVVGKFDSSLSVMIELLHEGKSGQLEFKLIDSTGAVYGHRSNVAEGKKWQRHMIPLKEMAYWWAGQQAKYPRHIQSLEIVFTTKIRGKQKIILKDIKVINE